MRESAYHTGISGLDSYVEGVLSGQINVCQHVKRAVDRHVHDMQRSDIEFSAEHATRFFDLCELLQHYEGKWAGKPLLLEPWQQFAFGSIFGWIIPETGLRRFREAYIEVPKKNGKSLIGAAVAIYGIMSDGESAAQVYGAATSRFQAKELSFRAASEMITQDAELAELLHIRYANGMEKIEYGNSYFKPLTSRPKSLDGFNVHFGLFDEVKDWETDELYNIIHNGTAAREQPLTLSITTAGSNQESLGYSLRTHLNGILNGSIDDDRFFGVIYTIDEDDLDRWDKPDVWEKANPNYAVSVNPSYFENQITKARNNQTNKNAFLTKHLNVWVSSSSAWFDMSKWKASHLKTVKHEAFRGKPALVAVDLASSSDLCSVYALHSDGKRFYTFGHNFLPEGVMQRKTTKNQLLYRAWEQSGNLTLTPGEYTDYEYIYMYMDELLQKYRVIAVGFDPYQAAEMMGKLQRKTNVVEVRPTILNLSQPMQDVERFAGLKLLEHGNDPVLRYAINNVVAKYDNKGNIYPTKQSRHQKIDPAIVMIMLFALHRQYPLTRKRKSRRKVI